MSNLLELLITFYHYNYQIYNILNINVCESSKVISQIDSNVKNMVIKHMKLSFLEPQIQS